MPAALHDQSSIYWISPTGDLGSGPTSLAISDLSAGFGSALAPPSSGSGGFGASGIVNFPHGSSVQVTPSGWRARCRGCGGVLEASHGAAR